MTDAPTTRRDVLLLLQRQLEELVSDRDTPASAVAACSRELRIVTAELEALNVGEEVSTVDELHTRRAARRSGDPASAARRSQPRRSGGSNRTG